MSWLPDQNLSIAGVFKTSFRCWFKGFPKIVTWILLCMAWAALPFFLFPQLNTHDPILLTQHLIANIASLIIYSIIGFILYLALYLKIGAVLNQVSVTFINNLLEASKRMIYFLPAAILSSLLLGIGYLALIIPGIYVTVVISFYYPLIIVDKAGIWEGLKAAFNLVWGQWWQSAVILFIPSLLFVILSFLIDLFATDIFTFTHPLGGEIWWFRHLLRMLLGFLYFPFLLTLILVQLNNLKLCSKQAVPAESNQST